VEKAGKMKLRAENKMASGRWKAWVPPLCTMQILHGPFIV
jgi:hypothetical protein